MYPESLDKNLKIKVIFFFNLFKQEKLKNIFKKAFFSTQDKNIDIDENFSQRKTKEEESDHFIDYSNKYSNKKEKLNTSITSFETVIEKKNEQFLNQKLKNINRGRILYLMEKIKKLGSNNVAFYPKEQRKIQIIPKKYSLKIRKLKFNSKPQVKKKIRGFPSQRKDFIELKNACQKMYEKCSNYYINNNLIEYKCDVCNNKNGNPNEYIRFDNILQCYQYIFYLIYEKKFLFKNIYQPRFIFELKMNLKNEINYHKQLLNEVNIRNICKCCLLKIIYLENIIKCIKAIFMMESNNMNSGDNRSNKKNNLSFLFKIVKVG